MHATPALVKALRTVPVPQVLALAVHAPKCARVTGAKAPAHVVNAIPAPVIAAAAASAPPVLKSR